MSLINRMLRDLSARQPRSGEVLSGIQVPRAADAPRRNWGRLALFIVLIAAFSAVLYPFMKRKPAAPPVAAETAPTAIAASAPPPAAGPRLQLIPALAPGSENARPAPRRSRQNPSSAKLAEAETLSAAPPPAAPKATSARDSKAAVARQDEAAKALARGEPKTAEQGFREALALDPSNAAAREALTLLLIEQNRLDEAQSVIDDGLALEPGRNSFRRLAARIDLARGQPARAVARLELSPPGVAADPEYYGLLASAYQRMDRHEDAARIYRSLTETQPGEAHWWAGYGISRDALGDVPGALAAYAQARSLGRLDPRVLEHINKRTAVLTAAS